MFDQPSVFNRTEYDSHGSAISANMYNLYIGLVLLWGFFVNYLMVKYIPVESLLQINWILFIIGYMACAFLGIFIYSRSTNPNVSFLGYNLVVLPFGLVVNIAVHQYDPAIVLEAIQVTGLVTALMMLLGTIYPKFFFKIAPALTIALICVIIVELVLWFFFGSNPEIMDWLVVVIFCGYIGYDWARANQIPKTLDNAVDSAAALYMDIIILFLRILSILGRRR